MLHYTVTEAKAKFSELFEKAFAGEEIIVSKMGDKAIKISPIKANKPEEFFGFMKTDYLIGEDFDTLPDEIARAFGMID